MAKSDDLLKDFLNGFPEASHPLDEERFAKYSIACAEEGKYIDTSAINQNVSPERSEELVFAFEWIRQAVDCLKNEGRL
ncbi:MAG: hypothetical protein K6D61_08980 [Prevotella sp.]|nr:hypothetical protein [Prevotella sp.]